MSWESRVYTCLLAERVSPPSFSVPSVQRMGAGASANTRLLTTGTQSQPYVLRPVSLGT